MLYSHPVAMRLLHIIEMLNLYVFALKERLARLPLPSCRRSCPQPSDQKKQRQSRFPQLPDKNIFDFYFHEKPCYLVEVLKHRGELPAGRTPVSREVVEDQILVTQKHCISEVQRGHQIINIARLALHRLSSVTHCLSCYFH